MIDEKEIRLLLKNIQKKEILDAHKLSVKDMFRICRCVAPEHDKELRKRCDNYAAAKCPLNKSFPVIVSQMFLNCVWWETFGPDSFEYTTEHMSEIMRRMKAVNKQCDRIVRQSKEAEKEKERVLEEKGLITQQELERELDEQKRKYEEKMDDNHREDRNAYKTLQKKIAVTKSDINHLASENNRIRIESDYLRKENEDLIRQIHQLSSPPHKS